ncbi:MAG TPA: Mov34/MPN/PAD-1 family protein [Thermoanaerobaculia bacterium]|jgi:proteasome lid subunit RPN8/RPN11
MLALLLVVILNMQLATAEAHFWYDALLAESGYGRLPHERAAFLISEADGTLTTQPWEVTGIRHASYRGAIPQRAIAIMHTHPRGEPHPSSRDRAEARRLGIPVIVVTTEGVIAAMPDGREARVRSAGR